MSYKDSEGKLQKAEGDALIVAITLNLGKTMYNSMKKDLSKSTIT